MPSFQPVVSVKMISKSFIVAIASIMNAVDINLGCSGFKLIVNLVGCAVVDITLIVLRGYVVANEKLDYDNRHRSLSRVKFLFTQLFASQTF